MSIRSVESPISASYEAPPTTGSEFLMAVDVEKDGFLY